jgi:hypothetical protein
MFFKKIRQSSLQLLIFYCQILIKIIAYSLSLQLIIALKAFFYLADFLCCKQTFHEALEPTRQQIIQQKQKIQLTIDKDLISFAGAKLVASNAGHQWNIMKFFLGNGQSIFSLRQITDELERNGHVITDPEQQIRRSIHRIRERTEAIGHPKDAIIKTTKAGYQLNFEAIQVLDIR